MAGRNSLWSGSFRLLFATAAVFGGFVLLVPAAHAAAEPLSSTPLFTNLSLVSYYPMEGNSSDTVNGHNGTDSYITYVTGQSGFGDCASFDGTGSSYITLPTSALPSLSSSFSISAWIYYSSYSSGNGYQYILDAGHSGGSPDVSFTYINNGHIQIYSNGSAYAENYTPTTNTWHLITAVYNSSAGTITFYADGASLGTVSGATVSGVPTTVHIGMPYNQTATYGYNGYMDDVSIFSTALTPTQISDLYTGNWSSPPPYIASSSLYQDQVGGTTLSEGGTITTGTVIFGAQLDSSGTSMLHLEVEAKPASTTFSNMANVSSTPVSPGDEATATIMNFATAPYNWQARVVDASGSASAWQSFSSTSSPDFTVDIPSLSVASTSLFTDDADLVSYYPMEGNADDTKGGNDGTAVNLLYGAAHGRFGQGAYFDATGSSYIILPTSSLPSLTSSFSISAWIRYSLYSSGNGYQYILDSGPSNPTLSPCESFVYTNTGLIQLYSNGTAYAEDYIPTPNAWHFVTAVYDSSAGTMTFYADGSSLGTISGVTITGCGVNTVHIGMPYNQTSNYGYNGDMDDVAVFASALSPIEISDLYYGILPPQESFYAQIENTATLNLRDASSTSANILKTLPADWVIQVVSSTDTSGNPMIAGGDHWYKVVDPTDSATGWMAASDTSGQYISSYDGGSQDSFASSSEPILTSTSSRAAAIVDAVQNYYTNSSTVSSLDTDEYADGSHNLSDIFNLSNATSVPEVLVYGMAAQESGGIGFDNSNVKPFYPAYGYGIMQLTAIPTSSDVYNLEVLLNKNSSTQIEASGPGSPGDETHDFTSDVTAAVENFQTENGISNTGNVFFLTRSALNALLPASSIPSDFRFNTNLAQGDDDRLSATSSPLGQVSGVSVPPCSNLQDPSNANYYQDCLGESSTSTPNQYYAPQSNYGNQTFDWYGNTVQSIYSNIKDALGVMRTKWYTWAPCTYGDLSFSAPGFATTTFTCNDRLNILSVWGYNGFATSSYLSNVANQLNGENIQNTFPTAGIPTSTSAEWYNKLEIGQANEFQFEQDSPVDSAVMDSEGRVTGIVNGELEVQIPDSAYDTRTHSGIVLFPQDTYTFRVQGDATGTYGFTVQSNDHSATSTLFHVDNFPTSPGAIHEYSIDFKKLEKGEPGITVKIDDKGNGKIDRVLTDVGTVSTEPAQTYPAPILTAPVIPQPTPAPRPQPPVRIFESGPQISTSTNAFSSSTFSVASSTIASSSSLMNFTSTIEIASSTIETNSSTENNE